MNSWSFRGAVFDFQPQTEVKDIPPYGTSVTSVTADTTYLRQLYDLRTSLYNGFFNASDKAFADANSNWALSADITSSRIFLGYYWGVFYPLGKLTDYLKYHRVLKFGAGLGVFYTDFSYKLNLCTQYSIAPETTDDGTVVGYSYGCDGKTEIDSAEAKVFGVVGTNFLTFWERVTKDSIWKFGSLELQVSLSDTASAFKLKNHDKNLEVSQSAMSMEGFSYTYRF